MGRSEYEKWLRWYGKKIRNGLWWPLLKACRLQRADLADANGGDNGAAAGSEDSAGEDWDVELDMEGAYYLFIRILMWDWSSFACTWIDGS